VIGETPEWMLWVLVGLLTLIMCLPGLKTLLRPVTETKGADPHDPDLEPFRSNEWRYQGFIFA
jgi:hypothetical protein